MSEQASFSQQPALIEGSTNGGGPSGSAERAWVRDLADGQLVEAVFAVRERELRQRRNGGQWLRLSVCDRSGTVEAVIWEGVDESFEVAAPGSAVHINGRFGVHPQYGAKITVETIRRARPEEFAGADLAAGPSVPVE
jgi:3'-5' exoribonuclease